MRVAVSQPEENLRKAEAWISEASRRGSDIICFPEMNITGYDVDAGLRRSAEPLPGAISERLCAMARRHATVILAGLAEQAADGGVFASHVVAAPEGWRGVYRKLHIAPPESAVFTAGRNVPVFDAAGIRFGIELCYDAHFPDLSTRLALQGVHAIFMPHASPRGTPEEKRASWMRHLPARAFDNGVFVVACNQTGDNGAGMVFPGVALVFGPDGRLIAADAAGREGLLLATLDAELLAAVRRHPMRYFLPHRRPELYDLH